jgi:hypothetical protein
VTICNRTSESCATLSRSAVTDRETATVIYGKHHPEGRDGGNSRNGRRAKTVLTDTGPVEISVPRDRDSSFEPRIVAKRQRRLTGVDEMVISLSAKGLTHGEIAAHLAGSPYLTGVPPIRPLRSACPEPAGRPYGALVVTPLLATGRDRRRRGSFLACRAVRPENRGHVCRCRHSRGRLPHLPPSLA